MAGRITPLTALTLDSASAFGVCASKSKKPLLI